MLIVPSYDGHHDLVARRRPVGLGLSVGHPLGTTGSVGPFVRLAKNRRGFISTASVLAPQGAKKGDYIHQPGPLDAEILTGATRVGTLGPFIRAVEGPKNRVDAAIVIIDEDVAEGNVVPAFAPSGGLAIGPPVEARVGDSLAFVGRTSGYSAGHVEVVDIDGLKVTLGSGTITLSGCLRVESPGGHFSLPGDAGALVWQQHDLGAVGIVLAADDEGATYVLPLGIVLSELEATFLPSKTSKSA